MCHKKRKLTFVSGAKPGTDPPVATCWVKDFILLHKYHSPNFYQIFCQKELHITPQNIRLQFYICCHKNYYATLMLLGNLCYMKTNINYRDQAWNNPPQIAGSRTSFYHISIILQTFTKGSVIL